MEKRSKEPPQSAGETGQSPRQRECTNMDRMPSPSSQRPGKKIRRSNSGTVHADAAAASTIHEGKGESPSHGGLSQSARKVVRERQRRSDLHLSFQTLIEKLSRIHPEVSSCPATDDSSERAAAAREDVARRLQRSIERGSTNEEAMALATSAPPKLNRVDIIECTIETLDRLVAEREETNARLATISRQLREKEQEIVALKARLQEMATLMQRNQSGLQQNARFLAANTGVASLTPPVVPCSLVYSPYLLSNGPNIAIVNNLADLLQSHTVTAPSPLQGSVPLVDAPPFLAGGGLASAQSQINDESSAGSSGLHQVPSSLPLAGVNQQGVVHSSTRVGATQASAQGQNNFENLAGVAGLDQVTSSLPSAGVSQHRVGQSSTRAGPSLASAQGQINESSAGEAGLGLVTSSLPVAGANQHGDAHSLTRVGVTQGSTVARSEGNKNNAVAPPS